MNLYLIVAIISSLLSFGTAWRIQDWRFGAKEHERVTQQLEIERISHIANVHREERVISAQNNAQVRATLARSDADGARSALVSLSSAVDTALSNAKLSNEACLVTATTSTKLLQSCGERYRGLAEVADRHVNDLQTLGEAWPIAEPQK